MGLSDVIKNLFSSSDELEYFEDEDNGYIEEETTPKKSFLDIFKKNKNQDNAPSVPIQNPFIRNNNVPQYSNNGIIKSIAPTDFNTASRNIVSDLKQGFILILNLEGSPIELQNRILDFTYGCVCSLGGNLKKISNSIYITGIDVDLSAFASSFSNTVYNNMNGNYDNSNTNNNFNNVFHNSNQNNINDQQTFNQNNNQNQYPNMQNNSQNFWSNFQGMPQSMPKNQNQGNYFQNNFNNNFQNFPNPNNNVNKPNFFKR